MYRKLKYFCFYLELEKTYIFLVNSQIQPIYSTMSTKQNSNSSVNQQSNRQTAAEAVAFRKSLEDRSAEDWCREGVSLCIPRVFANIGYKRIFGVFRRLNWGFVERVDTIRVQPKTGAAYKRAYVHYTPARFNQRDTQAMAALEHMIAGNDVQLEYEEGKPWFWKVSLSQARKPAEAPKPPKPPAVRLAGAHTQRRKTLDIGEKRELAHLGGEQNPGSVESAFQNGTSARVQDIVDRHDQGEFCPGNDPIVARALQTFSTPPVVKEEETDSRPLTDYGNVSVMDD